MANEDIILEQMLRNKLFKAFASAETEGEADPYIRTRVKPKKGSSAFGPVQLTKGKVEDYVTRNLLPEDSATFARNILIPMQQDMLKYGGSDMIPGKEHLDYGQGGGFPVEFRPMLDKLSKDMLMVDYKQSGGNIDEMIVKWRGKEPEERYKKNIKRYFK